MQIRYRFSLLMEFFLFMFSLSFLAASWASAAGKADEESIPNAYTRLPLYFVENKGQLDPEVRFYIKKSGQTIYFTDEGILFDLVRNRKLSEKSSEEFGKGHQTTELKAERLVFSLCFKNACKGLLIQGFDRQETGINYFTGNDRNKWKTDIPTYKGIIYKEVYESIDLKVFGKGTDIEYEFIVNPGGNPDDIMLSYNGIEGLATNRDGELIIRTAFGELRETRPYIYQEIEGKKVVDGSFETHSTDAKLQPGSFSYGFRVASFNLSYPLIIDPSLVYSTYLGGSSDDTATGIDVDTSGNVYITGITLSDDFPTANPFQGTCAGNRDAFVAKISQSGDTLIYCTFIGGSGDDSSSGIVIDGSGNMYITGQTTSTDFPLQNPYQGSHGGSNYDAFVTKISSSGSTLMYSSYLGGNSLDSGSGIAVDPSGNAYVSGVTASANFPIQSPFQGTCAGAQDIFITKISPSGNALVYSSYLGGSSGDFGFGTAIDTSGNAYVTGETFSTDFPMQNPFQGTFGGGTADAFITKISSSGSLIYSTYLGGSNIDAGTAVAVDGSGNAYVTGATWSSDFPLQNPCQGTFGGGTIDAFITKVFPSGNAISYSTFLGGNDDDSANGIAVDSLGNVYITGYTYSSDFPVTNPYQLILAGESDAILAKFDSSGNSIIYSTYLGGEGYDFGREIAIDGSGNAYITGVTNSSNFPTQSPLQALNAGVADVFILKLNDSNSKAIPVINKPGFIILSLILAGIGYFTIRRRNNASV